MSYVDDLYVNVRAVKVPKIQIDQIEQQFGAKLVSDAEYHTLLSLDATLKQYKLEKGREPDMVMLSDQPNYYYKHMVLNINFLGMEIPASDKKPAWFRFKRQFKLN